MIKRPLTVLLMAAFPGMALAQFYAGASVGQNRSDFKASDYSAGRPDIAESHDTDQLGLKLYGGYDFNRYLAIEAGYARLGSPKYRYASGGMVGQAKIRQESYFAAAKGTLPISERFNVFAKVGVTHSRARLDGNSNSAVINAATGFPITMSENNSRAMFGAGIEFSLAPDVLLRLEYEDFGKFGDDKLTGATKARLTSVGITYGF
jgi:OOP family OmpA-OmpF porin